MKGKKEVLDYFVALKKHGFVGPSYLFIGEDFSLVMDIVKLINCTEGLCFCDDCWDCRRIHQGGHPDLFLVEPENFTVKIDAVREGIRFLSLKGFRLKNKTLIVKDAQALKVEAANAFLKTLEEPPKNSFIVLCSSKLEGLLPTIISRCRKIFLPFKSRERDSSMEKSVSCFLKGEEIKFQDRKKFSSFLWTLITVLRADLISKMYSKNKRLPQNSEYEIILEPYNVKQMSDVLKGALEVHGAQDNININLALNLIRMKL